jgi:hypothetical protein
MQDETELITDTVGDGYIREFFHDSFGSAIHQIQCSSIIWLIKDIFF